MNYQIPMRSIELSYEDRYGMWCSSQVLGNCKTMAKLMYRRPCLPGAERPLQMDTCLP